MNILQDSLFLRSLNKKPVERTPVWLMRQAGRYLPEYRRVREKAGSFLNLCKTPELACEVTLQPIERFGLDASILFSDILTIPDAMGLGLEFIEGEGPVFLKPIQNNEDIIALPEDVMNQLNYVMEAVGIIRQALPPQIPLIGFSGSPWTLASYMIEGHSSRDFKKILKWMYQDPQMMHQLLMKLTKVIISYLTEQIRSGVNTVMIFDTWGGILSSHQYILFSLNYMQMIVKAIKNAFADIPVILFTKGGSQWLPAIAATGCNVVSLDWTCDLGKARAEVGDKVSLQGNLDPAVLLTNPEVIQREVLKVLQAYGRGSGHIFNLGHGITPDVPPENVASMVAAIQELSPAFHKDIL